MIDVAKRHPQPQVTVLMLQIGKKLRLLPSTQPKIYVSCSSEGYGHSSRAMALARLFPSEQMLVGSYGYALQRLKHAGLPCVDIPQEYKLVGVSGGFDVGRTISENHASFFNLNQMVLEECQIMKTHQVSLVVADGRIAPVMAASKLGLPCLVVTNQSDFYPFFRNDSTFVRLFGKSFEVWMQYWLSCADEILIPDFYPPDTVCLMNLSPSFHIKKRTRFTGPLVATHPKQVVAAPRPQETSYYVVVSLGGHQYRQPLLDAVLSIAPMFPHVTFDLLTSLPIFQLPPNVRRIGQVDNAMSFFKAADCVITQAGHSTAMELLTLGKPSIVVPDSAQSEQENNAVRMEQVGVSERVTYEQLRHQSEYLPRALNKVLNDRRYTRQAKRYASQAESLLGQQGLASVLSEYANRVLSY